MAKVTSGFTMSLDGFVAGPNDDVGRLFQWYRSGDTDFPLKGTDIIFKVSRASTEYMQEAWSRIGAIVTGRRDFDVSGAWGGQPPFGVPAFIVTHHPPQEWSHAGSPFTFVTDGVNRAFEMAKQVAGDKDVNVV